MDNWGLLEMSTKRSIIQCVRKRLRTVRKTRNAYVTRLNKMHTIVTTTTYTKFTHTYYSVLALKCSHIKVFWSPLFVCTQQGIIFQLCIPLGHLPILSWRYSYPKGTLRRAKLKAHLDYATQSCAIIYQHNNLIAFYDISCGIYMTIA